MANAWDQQPRETEPSYRAFLVYRDLGADRSFEAARVLYLPSAGGRLRSKRLLARWSTRHEWVERCRAWDNHRQAEKDRIFVAQVRAEETRRLRARY
jgi:hypothetical protein